MSQIRLTCGFESVQDVNSFFRMSTWKKGIALYEGHHLYNILEAVDDSGSKITGRCLPQTKLSALPYDIKIHVQKLNRTIESASCTCKAGIDGRCKHAAAVIVYVNHERTDSVTSNQQKWGIPTLKAAYEKGKRASLMFPPPMTTLKTQSRSLDYLSSFGSINCPLLKIVEAEQIDGDTQVCHELLRSLVQTIHDQQEVDLCKDTLNGLAQRTTLTFPSYEVIRNVGSKVVLELLYLK